jgi:hypothetical protein
MKPVKLFLIVMCLGLLMMACGGGSSSNESDDNTVDLSKQDQANLVATALSSQSGGIEDDINTATGAADGDPQPQNKSRAADLSLTVDVSVTYYDAQGHEQEAYDAETTDAIDYHRLIQGHLENNAAYFTEINVNNQSDFYVADILSRLVVIDGAHTIHSDYTRSNPITQIEVSFEVDGELTLTAVAVDLDEDNTFPESGIIEGSLSGSLVRSGIGWEQTTRFSFHFIATYLGDNTAEVELTDGTTFIVRLDTGDIEGL